MIPNLKKSNEIKDNRPISLLPLPSKIFETLIYRKLNKKIGLNLSHTQHGFTEDRSIFKVIV